MKTLKKILVGAAVVAGNIDYLVLQLRRRIREARGFVSQEEQQQLTASWPPVSGTTPGFTVKGAGTIRWGTDGLLNSPYPAGGGFYVVTKFDQKPIIDRSKLPNGTGITTTDVFLVDGATTEITVRDDSLMGTPPAINSNVTIVDAVGQLGAVGNTYSARVVDNGYGTAPKQAGERTLVCDNLVGIDSQTSSAQTAR